MTDFDPVALAALKARHLAFVEARVVSAKAEREWRANIAAAYGDLLATRLGDLAPGKALADMVDAVLTPDVVEKAVRPAMKVFTREMLSALHEEKGKVGDRIPEETKRRIDALVTKPGLIPGRFLHEIVKEDVVDDVMRDVLFDALKEFSERVNPLVAEWGLPAVLKKITPFGLGRGLKELQSEFDRRLEPEIRRFLQGFSRRSLPRVVDFVVAHGDQGKFLVARRRLVEWLLAQHVAELGRATDAEAIQLAQDITLDIASSEFAQAEHRARRRGAIERAIVVRQERTVGEVLAEIGVTIAPDFDALAAATWPLARAALATPTAQSWFASLVEEFYDSEIAGSAG
jgi:hypothetical protein